MVWFGTQNYCSEKEQRYMEISSSNTHVWYPPQKNSIWSNLSLWSILSCSNSPLNLLILTSPTHLSFFKTTGRMSFAIQNERSKNEPIEISMSRRERQNCCHLGRKLGHKEPKIDDPMLSNYGLDPFVVERTLPLIDIEKQIASKIGGCLKAHIVVDNIKIYI